MILPERLGQVVRKHDALGNGELADLLRHPLLRSASSASDALTPSLRLTNATMAPALELVGDTDDGGPQRPRIQRRCLQLRRADAVCPATFTTSSTRPTIQK
jgi:hypothetical protein